MSSTSPLNFGETGPRTPHGKDRIENNVIIGTLNIDSSASKPGTKYTVEIVSGATFGRPNDSGSLVTEHTFLRSEVEPVTEYPFWGEVTVVDSESESNPITRLANTVTFTLSVQHKRERYPQRVSEYAFNFNDSRDSNAITLNIKGDNYGWSELPPSLEFDTSLNKGVEQGSAQKGPGKSNEFDFSNLPPPIKENPLPVSNASSIEDNGGDSEEDKFETPPSTPPNKDD